MSASLEIDDGSPWWWESLDIWVVPGTDPLGSPGAPVAGEPAYVWARVHNRGDIDVSSVLVNFWWSNPTTGVTRSLSNFIGNAYVDVAAGATEEVLCLSAWMPTIVNDGHECLVCEAISTADPLVPAPGDPFDPFTYHQVAQRNLSVLGAAPVAASLQMAQGSFGGGEIVLLVEIGGILDDAALVTLGLQEWRPAQEPFVRAGLASSPACDVEFDEQLRVETRPGQVAGAFLHIRPVEVARKGEYTLVRVRETGTDAAGGITYVVCGGGERA